MEIRWLQDFLAVAETGNFTRAAAMRNTSQAAFSRRIQQLEGWIGVPLIDRSVFPTALTPKGEQFRVTASNILSQMLEMRSELKGFPDAGGAQHFRLAMPYVLATARFPAWWTQWTRQNDFTATLVVGNAHEIAVGLTSGAIDMMIGFSAAQQPFYPERDGVESIEMETDFLRPFISPALLEREGYRFPGEAHRPLPLLMYSSGVYFARLVDLIIENAGGITHRRHVIENDMSDVLRDMAIEGHGIAWLPESTVAAGPRGTLVAIGGAQWSMPMSILAMRERANTNPAVSRLWQLIRRTRQTPPARRRPSPHSPRLDPANETHP
ncbi:LysR family transcriptional regulator [Ancylobacter sp. 6x-1]|uniref:LysR family transcriptional regulator n=1 Tax=Ancylobacter crimeensis TaxID=2579147 RepID=A0ABT0D949_9HYPH|nr:LysR family transcriptional regulator [Ancylobacter crimeensis]MCK0196480.1 LysR family transcriptional regulator [Ancylobacter crimeensis]